MVNVFDLMVRNLMQPESEGGSGLTLEQALAIAEKALPKLKAQVP